MKFIKQHKSSFIIGVIAFVLLIILILGIKNLFYSGGKNKFGNRLNGINEVMIPEDKYQKIASDMEATGYVEKVTYHTVGRTINYSGYVKKDTSLENAKTLSDKILSNLTDAEKKFYDIQIFLTQKENEESELYPAIGYKGKTSAVFSWSNKNIGGTNEA